MADDFTQVQDGEEYQRAKEASLQHRRAPGRGPGYLVERCLGEGAYGEVWVATDQNNPGRRVAIKFYTRRGGDWALLAREVEKLNYLATDRYIVQLIDVGWNADPPYYVMEFMEKGSLAEKLEGGPLPVPEAVALFREVAVGVVNAHNRGVLHCDLKPANVLLGLDGKPRLADFGQSRVAQDQTPALGTLFYMAPEQADLKATPDARWDVYALGALLYCLLTGAPPYHDAPEASALKEPMSLEERLARYRRLLKESPRPRKHRRLAGVDRALRDIIDRCLAVNPAKRYPNVQAVLDALDLRTLRRARRPLLVMGAVGPILLLLLMGYFIQSALNTAVQESTAALTEETRDSNEFAAQAVAAKVAGKIDRRWRILEQEASDPELHKLLQAARGAKYGDPAQRALSAWMVAMAETHPDIKASSWSVFDDQGTFLARSPANPAVEKKYVGLKYPRKNFFSGLDKDLDEKAPAPAPLTHVRRSNVFESQLTGTRMVAFSVPIWKGKPPPPDWKGKPNQPEHPRLGVLMMAVDVGSFVELGPEGGLGGEKNKKASFLAVLVDRRPDANGRRGAILEHPYLAQLRKEKVPEKNLQFFANLDNLANDSWDPNYEDPIGAANPEYKGHWLAASAPVHVEERPDARDTNWVVIVQERYDVAIGPVLQLQADMLARGWWFLGMALAVVTGLWAFVIVVLNETSSSRLVTFLKRRAGLAVESLSTTKASLVRSPREQPLSAADGATVLEPPGKEEGTK